MRIPTGRHPAWVRALLFLVPILGAAVLAAASARAGHPVPLTLLPQRPAAPTLELPDVAGRVHNIAHLRGRVVLVNFWTTWCPPCRSEMLSLQRLHEAFARDQFAMLTVNLGETQQDIARFFFTLGRPPSYTILISEDRMVPERWHVKNLPTTYIIDKSGRVSYVARGARSWDSRDIRMLLWEMVNSEQVGAAAPP